MQSARTAVASTGTVLGKELQGALIFKVFFRTEQYLSMFLFSGDTDPLSFLLLFQFRHSNFYKGLMHPHENKKLEKCKRNNLP
jgi:hypothetical protein